MDTAVITNPNTVNTNHINISKIPKGIDHPRDFEQGKHKQVIPHEATRIVSTENEISTMNVIFEKF